MRGNGQWDDDENQIKNVVSHKKQEHRVQIRQRKVAADLQSKRLKIIQSSSSSSIAADSGGTRGGGSGQLLVSEQSQTTSDCQSMRFFYNDVDVNMGSEGESLLQPLQSLPSISEFPAQLDLLLREVNKSFLLKEVGEISQYMNLLHEWVRTCIKIDIEGSHTIISLLLNRRVHILCVQFLAPKYIQSSLPILSESCYYLLAQLSTVATLTHVNEMIKCRLISNVLVTIQLSESPQALDNMFHMLGNLTGDNTFGKEFSLQLTEREVSTLSVGVLQRFPLSSIKIFVQSFSFFLYNYIKSIPDDTLSDTTSEILLPAIVMVVENFALQYHESVSVLCLLFECCPSIIAKLDDSHLSLIVRLSREEGKLRKRAIKLISMVMMTVENQDVDYDDDDYDEKLLIRFVEAGLIYAMVSILDSGKVMNRRNAARILTNIASVADESVQKKLLSENEFRRITRAMLLDERAVKEEIVYILLVLTINASADTVCTLLKHKEIVSLLKLIFDEFQGCTQIEGTALNAVYALSEAVQIQEQTLIVKFIQEVEAQGLEATLEQLSSVDTEHSTVEADLASHILQTLAGIKETIHNSFDEEKEKEEDTTIH